MTRKRCRRGRRTPRAQAHDAVDDGLESPDPCYYDVLRLEPGDVAVVDMGMWLHGCQWGAPVKDVRKFLNYIFTNPLLGLHSRDERDKVCRRRARQLDLTWADYYKPRKQFVEEFNEECLQLAADHHVAAPSEPMPLILLGKQPNALCRFLDYPPVRGDVQKLELVCCMPTDALAADHFCTCIDDMFPRTTVVLHATHSYATWVKMQLLHMPLPVQRKYYAHAYKTCSAFVKQTVGVFRHATHWLNFRTAFFHLVALRAQLHNKELVLGPSAAAPAEEVRRLRRTAMDIARLPRHAVPIRQSQFLPQRDKPVVMLDVTNVLKVRVRPEVDVEEEDADGRVYVFALDAWLLQCMDRVHHMCLGQQGLEDAMGQCDALHLRAMMDARQEMTYAATVLKYRQQQALEMSQATQSLLLLVALHNVLHGVPTRVAQLTVTEQAQPETRANDYRFQWV